MKLRIRFRVGESTVPSGAGTLFGGLESVRVPRIGTLLSSAAIHVVVILLITVVSTQIALWYKDDEVDWSRYSVEPLRIHLAEPLFFRASSSAKAQAARHAPKPAESSPESGRGAVATVRRPSFPVSLELPVPAENASNAPVIIQPEFRPQATPPSALPPLAFWARQIPPPKPASADSVIVPGRAEAPSASPKLNAPPVVAVPNREQALADINLSQVPKPAQQAPALPVPNSATTPVRVRTSTETQAASFEVSSGQPANVLTLAAERRDLRDIEIPRGLQNIPNTADNGGIAASQRDAARKDAGANHAETAATNGSSKGPDAASKTDSNPRTEAAAGADSKTRSGPQEKAGTSPAAAPGSGTVARTASAPVEAASAGVSPATTAGATHSTNRPEITHIDHPANGSFDVVITQSASRDDFPDVGGMLTGNPVYTVYLRVGDQREWLLEYCLPVNKTQQSSPYQINIDDATPLSPPYPISTAIPNTILGQAITRHIVLQGLLTASGKLQNMKTPGAANPVTMQILSLLDEWQFRPALRDKKPIDVEILLVIPARS